MKELLMKLLVEHGDREFTYLWGKGVFELIQNKYLCPKVDLHFDPEDIHITKMNYTISPAGLEYLKNA